MDVLVSDASSLILLEKIDLLDILVKKFTIFISEEVYKEVVVKGKEKNAADAHKIEYKIINKKLNVIKVKSVDKVQKLMSDFGIQKGETEAIILFLEREGKYVLVDDHKAINACKAYKIPFLTTVNIVLIILKQKMINKKVAENMIKHLAIYGRYKNELIFKALEEVEKNE